MKLGNVLHAQLQLLAQGSETVVLHPQEDSTLLLAVGTPDTQMVTITMRDHDRYSLALHSLSVMMPVSDASESLLQDAAAEVVRCLNFLEEPLGVWELSVADQTAQLRSLPPMREGAAVTYWEVSLSTAESFRAELTRYRWEPGIAERTVVSYPATFGLLARITDSLVALP